MDKCYPSKVRQLWWLKHTVAPTNGAVSKSLKTLESSQGYKKNLGGCQSQETTKQLHVMFEMSKQLRKNSCWSFHKTTAVGHVFPTNSAVSPLLHPNKVKHYFRRLKEMVPHKWKPSIFGWLGVKASVGEFRIIRHELSSVLVKIYSTSTTKIGFWAPSEPPKPRIMNCLTL